MYKDFRDRNFPGGDIFYEISLFSSSFNAVCFVVKFHGVLINQQSARPVYHHRIKADQAFGAFMWLPNPMV